MLATGNTRAIIMEAVGRLVTCVVSCIPHLFFSKKLLIRVHMSFIRQGNCSKHVGLTLRSWFYLMFQKPPFMLFCFSVATCGLTTEKIKLSSTIGYLLAVEAQLLSLSLNAS